MFPWAIGSARLIPFTFVYPLNKHCSVAADLSRHMESGGGGGPPQRLAQPLQSPPVRTECLFFFFLSFVLFFFSRQEPLLGRGGVASLSLPRPGLCGTSEGGRIGSARPLPWAAAPRRRDAVSARRGARGSAAALRRTPSGCPGPTGRCRTSRQRLPLAEAGGKQRCNNWDGKEKYLETRLLKQNFPLTPR